MSEFPGFGGGIIGTVVGIISSISSLWRGYKVDSFIGAIVSGLSSLAKSIAQALTTFILETRLFLSLIVHALQRLWNVVLRPLLQWAKQKFLSLSAWLKRTFLPLVRIIDRLRKEWRLFYTRFLRPILDAIDVIRFFLRELGRLGVTWASDLDKTLARIEDKINADWLWVYGKLTEVRNAIDQIVTLDYFVQRLVFLRTLNRDAPELIALFWKKQIDPTLRAGDDYSRTRTYPFDEPFANGKELAAFYVGADNRMSSTVDALVPLWREAAGFDPPSGEGA